VTVKDSIVPANVGCTGIWNDRC